MLPIFDMATQSGRAGLTGRLDLLRQTVATTGPKAKAVAQIIDDVRREGDAAVVRHMRQWTDPAFSAERIAVTPAELDRALDQTPPALRQALEQAIDHVGDYQRHILPKPPPPVTIAGAELGMRFMPVDRAGLAVPGGRASYPSTVVMLAVPAMTAGVPADSISVITPPPTRHPDDKGAGTDVSPLVLATCRMLGIRKVYRIGGAQAIAALALGTATVQPVDLIVGPGNEFVQLAKLQLCGVAGIDGFYGPSEIVTIADDTARIAGVAADLIAQAEHDPGRCFLIAWQAQVIDAVNQEIARQLPARGRRAAIEASFKDSSAALLAKDLNHAVDLANQIAAEHVNLAVADPEDLLPRIRHGGEFFLGDTPVAAGDYYAGPSHCLPTGTTARFASGISVYTFLKRSGTVHYRHGMPPAAIAAIAALAQAEGLDGHAESARLRGRG